MRALVSLAVLASMGLAAPATQAAPPPKKMLAMGDSYSAASGVFPPDPTASPFCARSTANHGHVVASRIGAVLTDVSCGAADTSDYFTPQYEGVPAQLDAVTADLDLITMTIGGNDSGVFINAIIGCSSAGLSTAGQGSPCQDRYGTSFEDTVRNVTYPSLVTTLQAVRAKAPDARIAILGYPWILPETVGCFDKMPVASGDVPYLRHLQWTLNDAVRRAADAADVRYVDMNEASNGHDACKPIGVRWIEPAFQGTNPVIVHPNAFGESEMARRVIETLKLR